MQTINYNDLYKRTNAAIKDRDERAREMGYKDYNDYLDSFPSEMSYEDRYWKFSKDYNNFVKENLRPEDIINGKEPSTVIFEGKKNLDSIIENNDIFNIKTVMKIVKAAYKNENDLTDDELPYQLVNGEKIVYEMIQRGVNKEQIILMLLKEEKVWTEQLVKQAKKKQNIDEELILKFKKELRNIYRIKRVIGKIETPYDKLIDRCEMISETKNQQKNEKLMFIYGQSTEATVKREMKILSAHNYQLSKDLEEVDPRIVYDVVKDKIEANKLQMEIDDIQAGVEPSLENDKLINDKINAIKQKFNPLIQLVKQNIEKSKQVDNGLKI